MKALQMSGQGVSHKQTSSGSNGIAGPIVPAKGVTDAVEVGAHRPDPEHGKSRSIVRRPIAGAAIDRLAVPIRRGIDHPLTRYYPFSGADGTHSSWKPAPQSGWHKASPK